MRVSLHVGEVHSEVVPAGGTPGTAGGREGSGVPDDAERWWRQVRGRVEWLAARVAAEDFDD
jgi:hypothetical protein